MGRSRRWLGAVVLLSAWPGVAGAAPPSAATVAPAEARELSRATAQAELGALLARLPPESRRRLVGTYVAFDPTQEDVSALGACDDDGDYVVVVSDALLTLARHVAQAEALDEALGTHKLEEYAAFLAENEAAAPNGGLPRPLPPPAGFFDQAASEQVKAVASARFREILSGIVADELQRLLQGDLTCPNPTATHEHGDDQWTKEEREHALTVARKLYDAARVLSADGAATGAILDRGSTETGLLGWLRVLARIEAAPRAPAWSYLALHPDTPVRQEVVRASADQWRRVRAARVPAGAVSPPRSAER